MCLINSDEINLQFKHKCNKLCNFTFIEVDVIMWVFSIKIITYLFVILIMTR